MTWHDLRIWLSGFCAAVAVAAFVTATVVRIRARGRHGDVPKIPAQKIPAVHTHKTGTAG